MAREFSIADALRLQSSLMSRDASLLPLVGAVWFGLVVILTGFMQSGLLIGPTAVSLLAGSFFSAVLTYSAVGRYTPSLNEAVSVAGRAYLTVLAVSVLGFAVTMIGFFLLVLPGIAAMVLFGLVVPIVMAERPGIIETFRRSFDLVWPFVMPVLGFVVIVAIPAFIVIGLASAFIEGLLPGLTGQAISAGFQAAAGGIISI